MPFFVLCTPQNYEGPPSAYLAARDAYGGQVHFADWVFDTDFTHQVNT